MSQTKIGEDGTAGAEELPTIMQLKDAKIKHNRIYSEVKELIRTQVTRENAPVEVPKYTSLLKASLNLSQSNFRLFNDAIKEYIGVVQELKATVNEKISEIEALKTAQQESSRDCSTTHGKLIESEIEKQRLSGDLGRHVNDLTTSRASIAKLTAAAAASEARIDELTAAAAASKARIDELTAAAAAAAAASEARIDELKASAKTNAAEIARLTEALAAANEDAKRAIDLGEFNGLGLSQSPDAQGSTERQGAAGQGAAEQGAAGQGAARRGSSAGPGGGKLRKTRGKRRRKYTRK